MIGLHIGGATTATALVSVIVIFFLVFAFSFAFGQIPSGESRFGKEWLAAWSRATLPRFIAAALFSAALFAGSSLYGDGGSNGPASAAGCDNPVAPLTGGEVTDARILLGSEGMLQIADAAADGRIDGAQSLFFSLDAHNLTHDIDAPLRAVDQSLARDLCRRVIVLENQMAGTLDAAVMEREARAIADMLAQARDVLANAPSPSSSASTLGPCSNPIGAVTDDPLTEARLSSVIETYRQVAQDAPAAPVDELTAAFAGDAHDLSHDIDGPLRRADLQLALDLCHSVLQIEREFAGGYNRDVIASESLTTAGILEEAGVRLGILE